MMDSKKPHERKRIDFLGLPIDRLSLEQTVNAIEGFINSGGCQRIIVINAGKVIKARKDPKLKRIIEKADLVGPDGMWVVFGSKLIGEPLPGRVNGTDLMDQLLKLAHERNFRVFFLGARQQVVEKVVEIAQKKYPGMVLAGYRNGYFQRDEEPAIVQSIRNSAPHILFIAIPSPQKEYFVERNFDALRVPICHGVGGSFDVMAGVVKRAPVWVQRMGLEFVYRWWQEPLRMTSRNIFEDPYFLALVLFEALKRRLLRVSNYG